MDLEEAAATGEVDLANALDLSDSEEEEEYEDLIHDFALQAEVEQVITNLPFHPTFYDLTLSGRTRTSDKKDSTSSNFPTRFLYSLQWMSPSLSPMSHHQHLPPQGRKCPSPQTRNHLPLTPRGLRLLLRLSPTGTKHNKRLTASLDNSKFIAAEQ